MKPSEEARIYIRHLNDKEREKEKGWKNNEPILWNKYQKIQLMKNNRKTLISKNLEENYGLARNTDVKTNEDISEKIVNFWYEKELQQIEEKVSSYFPYSMNWYWQVKFFHKLEISHSEIIKNLQEMDEEVKKELKNIKLITVQPNEEIEVAQEAINYSFELEARPLDINNQNWQEAGPSRQETSVLIAETTMGI